MNLAATPTVIHPPARKVSSLWRGYLIFTLCAATYLLPFMRIIFLGSDQGTLLYGAVRIVHGQVFARDFFEAMGPGTFYYLAAFFKLFGVTFLASRICLFVSSLGTGISIYFLSRRACGRYRMLPCLVFAGTCFGAVWPGISHHVDSNFFALLSVVCLALWYASRKNFLLIAAGSLAGVTTCVLQPKGMLLFCAFLVWLWLLRRKVSAPLSALGLVTGGYFGFIGLVLAYFWSQGALGSLVYVDYVYPSQHYTAVNNVVYAQGILKDYWTPWVTAGGGWFVGIAAILIAPLLFIAALPFLMIALGIRSKWRYITPEITLYWLCGWALWLSELHRRDIYHLVFGSPLLIILFFHVVGESRRKAVQAAVWTLAVAAVCLAIFNFVNAAVAGRTISTRAGTVAILGSDQVLMFLNEHVSPGEEILVYPYAPTYYFLSATTNPTRYSFLMYNYNTPSQFREVIDILDQRRVRYVIWDTNFGPKVAGEIFPGSWPRSPRDLILEPYLESHYRLVEDDSGIHIMERKGEDLEKERRNIP